MDKKDKQELQEIINEHSRDRIFKEELAKKYNKLRKYAVIPATLILAAVAILINANVDWPALLEALISLILT